MENWRNKATATSKRSGFLSAGLLDAPAREANGYRSYADAHLVQLNFVRHCRSLGIGLPEVRMLRSFQPRPELSCEKIDELIDRLIVRIHEQLESPRLLEHQLHSLRDDCKAQQTARDCGILRTLAQAAEGEVCSCHPGAQGANSDA